MENQPDKVEGFFASWQRLRRTFLAIVLNRLELLLVELQEERCRFIDTILLVVIVIVMAFLTLLVATFTLVVYCMEDHRLDLLVGLGLFYLLATIGLAWRLRSRLKSWTPFSATLAELKKDKACLDDKS